MPFPLDSELTNRRQTCAKKLRAFDAPAAAQLAALVDLIEHLRSKQSTWPAELENVRLWYGPHLERLHSRSSSEVD